MAVTRARPTRSGGDRDGDRFGDSGVALVWGLALVQVLLVVGMVALAVGAQAVARERAAGAADIAAIAAAQAWGDPCRTAEASARANDATLTSCTSDGLDVRVTVAVPPPPVVMRLLGLLGRQAQPVVASARAGPPST